MKPSPDPQRLVEIMAALRDPETGCPWDKEQTFASIAPYTLEEAYEVVDAIDKDDMANLQEELGDLLLQVVYHSQMAAEAGHFEFSDVVDGITRKMIRRHPHVFGDEKARTAGMAKGTWERIKAQETAEKAALRAEMGQTAEVSPLRLLDDVPKALPALTRAEKIQDKVAKIGFDWDDPALVLDKLEEEIAEAREAIAGGSTSEIAGEIGDLLFTLVNLARHVDVDPEDALRGCNTKFSRRFAHIEQSLAEQGISLADAPLEAMEALWIEAKKAEI
ncbi:MAG: nucleoside triphosphate pyrophosphohydrolase [Pseudomonadota bacterium]